MQVEKKHLIIGGVSLVVLLGGIGAYFATRESETTPNYITGTPTAMPTQAPAGAAAPQLANEKGELDLAKAMTALFGNYDASQRIARWTTIAPPSRAKQFASWSSVVEGRVELMSAQGYIENGQQKIALITRTTPMSYGQAGSQGMPALLGVFVYARVATDWQLEKENRYLEAMGQFEGMNKATLVKIGTLKYGVLFEGSSVAREARQFFAELADVSLPQIKLVSERISTGLDQTGSCEQDNSCSNYAGSITFVKGKNPEYYDVKVVFTGVDATGNPAQQTDRYAVGKGRYRLASSTGTAAASAAPAAPAEAAPAAEPEGEGL